ncbi:hypothetical protein ACQ0YF_004492, partial [Shigella sonnei]
DNQPPPLNLRHDLQLSLVEQAEALLKQREPLDSCWILPNSFSKIKHIYISSLLNKTQPAILFHS